MATRILRNGGAISARAATITSRRVNRARPAEADEPEDQVVQMPEDDTSVLTDILDRARYEPRAARGGEYLHVSDLLGKCIRKFAIIEQHGLTRSSQRLSLMDLLTFGVGDTIHDIVKSRAAHASPGQIWGNWECKCGATLTSTPCLGSQIPVKECPTCHKPVDTYVEVPMRDDDLKIVGTPDLIVYLKELRSYYITELKSIAHEKWKELARPLPEHVIQVLFYWYLMRKLGYPVTNRVSILYVTKGYIFVGSPLKEFSFDPEEMMSRLDPYLEEARALKVARAGGALPPRIQCSSENAPEAKKCEVCSICFGNGNATTTKISIASALGRSAVPARRTR